MAKASLRILLIDDKPFEGNIVETTMMKASPVPVRVNHVSLLRHALSELSNYRYNMIFLDHFLARQDTIRETVPEINHVRDATPLVLLTSDTSRNYLSCPVKIGVDHIVDRATLQPFAQSVFDGRLRGSVCDACVFARKKICDQGRWATGDHSHLT